MSVQRNIPGIASHDARVETWELKANDEGAIIDAIDYARASFQLTGELAGATAQIVGRISVDHKFAPLNDGDAFPVNLRDGRIIEVPHLTVVMLKPVIHGGNENTNVKVSALLRR